MSAPLRIACAWSPVDGPGRGREHVAAQRAASRACVAAAAGRMGAPWDALRTDSEGVPLEVAGWYGSVAHSHRLAVAAVAPAPIGVDVEWLGRRRLDALEASCDPEELGELLAVDAFRLLRLWTAKEAVLKMERIGLSGLPGCRLLEFPRYGRARVRSASRVHEVRQDLVGDYQVALACDVPGGFELELVPAGAAREACA